jgi:GNAT superfamily N-acetyltransferase
MPRRIPKSPNDLWAWAKQIDGYPDTEWTFPVFLARLMALEGLSPQHFYEYASSYEDVLLMLHRHKRLHDQGVPVAMLDTIELGVEWFESGFRARNGRLPLPSGDDPFRGRHSVRAIGWDDGGETIHFQDSWGAWGDAGTGYMPRAYFERYVDSVFIQRSARWGPSPAAYEAFEKLGGRGAGAAIEAQVWRTLNRGEEIEDVLIEGKRHSLARFRTYSFRTQHVVDVLELRHPFRPVARCHSVLHLDTSPFKSVIQELFVLPRFRRWGYASFLEQEARELAAEAGCGAIEIDLYEADARLRSKPAAVGFADAAGYSWQDRAGRRPNLEAVARRTLAG